MYGGPGTYAGKKAWNVGINNRAQLYAPEIQNFTNRVSDKVSNTLTHAGVSGMIGKNMVPASKMSSAALMSMVKGTPFEKVFSDKPEDAQKNAVRHYLLNGRNEEYRKLKPTDEDLDR
jgi:hypothetical protein